MEISEESNEVKESQGRWRKWDDYNDYEYLWLFIQSLTKYIS